MVDDTGPDSHPRPEPMPGPTSLRREKPIIEGKVLSEASPEAERPPEQSHSPAMEAGETPPESVADEAAGPNGGSPAGPASEPPIESDTPRPDPAAPQPTRRSSWPIAAGIVVGALLGAGGAYLARSFDTTPDTVATLAAQNKQLANRIEALESKQAKPDPGAASLRDSLKAQEQQLSAQEKRIAAAEAAAHEAQTAAKSAVAEASAQHGESNAEAGNAPSAPAPDLGPLEQHVGDLDQRLTTLDQKLGQMSAQVSAAAAPKTEVRAPEDKNVQASPEADAQTNAIIAESLVGKVERGAPFGRELTVLANRGADKNAIATLEPTAANGVATTAALAKQFAALSNTLLTVEPVKLEGSFLDRLSESAARLVRLRKLGDTAGSDLPAHVNRITNALQLGADDEALNQWNDLPDAAKAKSQAFGAALKQRVDAVHAARMIESEAIAALGKTKS